MYANEFLEVSVCEGISALYFPDNDLFCGFILTLGSSFCCKLWPRASKQLLSLAQD